MTSVNVSGNPIGDKGKAILSNAAEARGMVLQMADCDLDSDSVSVSISISDSDSDF